MISAKRLNVNKCHISGAKFQNAGDYKVLYFKLKMLQYPGKKQNKPPPKNHKTMTNRLSMILKHSHSKSDHTCI